MGHLITVVLFSLIFAITSHAQQKDVSKTPVPGSIAASDDSWSLSHDTVSRAKKHDALKPLCESIAAAETQRATALTRVTAILPATTLEAIREFLFSIQTFDEAERQRVIENLAKKPVFVLLRAQLEEQNRADHFNEVLEEIKTALLKAELEIKLTRLNTQTGIFSGLAKTGWDQSKTRRRELREVFKFGLENLDSLVFGRAQYSLGGSRVLITRTMDPIVDRNELIGLVLDAQTGLKLADLRFAEPRIKELYFPAQQSIEPPIEGTWVAKPIEFVDTSVATMPSVFGIFRSSDSKQPFFTHQATQQKYISNEVGSSGGFSAVESKKRFKRVTALIDGNRVVLINTHTQVPTGEVLYPALVKSITFDPSQRLLFAFLSDGTISFSKFTESGAGWAVETQDSVPAHSHLGKLFRIKKFSDDDAHFAFQWQAQAPSMPDGSLGTKTVPLTPPTVTVLVYRDGAIVSTCPIPDADPKFFNSVQYHKILGTLSAVYVDKSGRLKAINLITKKTQSFNNAMILTDKDNPKPLFTVSRNGTLLALAVPLSLHLNRVLVFSTEDGELIGETILPSKALSLEFHPITGHLLVATSYQVTVFQIN